MKFPLRISNIPSDYKKNSINITSFRPCDNESLCKEFHLNQKRIFERQFKSENISSLDESWMKDENVYAICAMKSETNELIGGFRIHICNKKRALPIELAIGLEEPRIYDIVDSLSKNGCLEFCALWISLKGLQYGLTAYDLIRGVISISLQLNIENIISFAGPNSKKYISYYGLTNYSEIGQKGFIYYPTEKVKCTVTSGNILNVYNKLNHSEKRILKTILDNTKINIVTKYKNNFCYIHYNLKIMK